MVSGSRSRRKQYFALCKRKAACGLVSYYLLTEFSNDDSELLEFRIIRLSLRPYLFSLTLPSLSSALNALRNELATNIVINTALSTKTYCLQQLIFKKFLTIHNSQ